MNWDTKTVVTRDLKFNTYYKCSQGGPMLIFHHGMGSSASTFACVASELEEQLPNCGLLAYDARYHGYTTAVGDAPARPSFDIEDLIDDFVAVTSKFDLESEGIVLIGHSMGGTVMSKVSTRKLLSNVKGLVVLDAVEEYAQKSLRSMPALIGSWPKEFVSEDEAVQWSLKQLLRNPDSAIISIPPTIQRRKDGLYRFTVDLMSTSQYWESWFKGLDEAFLTSPAARLLILAGTGRLDKHLMVGNMQGKFQLVVMNECNHFIHEDAPRKVALTIVDFWERNSAPVKIVPKFGSFR